MQKDKPDLIEALNAVAERIASEKHAYDDPVLAHLVIFERQVSHLNAYIASAERAARAAERQAEDARRR